MTRLFYDKDCSIEPLAVFIGYGNQGRAQALNLRDTLKAENVQSTKIIIANQEDSYAKTANDDGFGYTTDFGKAASEADVLFLLVPDQPDLFNAVIAPSLKKTACIVVASGYNVFYNYLKISPSNDVIMAAPRMVGASVRSLHKSNKGYPCFVSVEQDGTGNAWPLALAVCRGIGATKGGAIESSCREEALIDLFAEQAIFPAIINVFTESYKILKGLGCSDEALVHEMWLSSQYGQLKGSQELDVGDVSSLRRNFKNVAENRILGGTFAEEFTTVEQTEGGINGALKKLYEEANKSELAIGEKKVRDRLGLDT